LSQDARPVHAAIDRWETRGLVPPELAERLRRDVDEASHAGTARLGQYVLAATAAVVLLIAAGVFVDWAWPRIEEEARSTFLAVLGVGVHLWGARMEWSRRWLPAALLMQIAGLGLLLGAFAYSDRVWSDGPAAVLVGVLALAVPLVLAPRAFRRSVVMPAVHLCFGLTFLAVFLDRAAGLDPDAIVWVLDGVLMLAALGLVRTLRSDPHGERHPWALNAFVAAVYAGFFLVLATGVGPLDLDEATVVPLDLWLLLVVGLTLWGTHLAPPGLRRDWFGSQLAWAVVLWIPLGMYTALETLDGPPELALVLVGGAAVAGFAYAVRFRVRRVLTASAVAFIAPTWYWAVDRGGAIGAVVALAATAVALFRLSGRVQTWLGDEPTSS
jgi:uncharacterized membrane protein